MTGPTSENDAFLSMAKLMLTADEEMWTKALAQLLEVAASGRGHLPAKEVLGDLDRSALPKHLMVEDGSLLLLARTAAHWRKIRAHAEGVTSTQREWRENEEVRQALDSIFPAHQLTGNDNEIIFDNVQQRLAVSMLVDAPFGVLTGGPGTGKTTTAAALLAVRRRLDPALDSHRVLVCAPTGKAANRLKQSLLGACERLALKPEEKTFLEALSPITLHRALGWTPKPPEQGGPFQHSAEMCLDVDIVLVDESSMVDLALMAHLIDALPDRASLILLGDRDQLESVEAGGVLAELVKRGSAADLPEAMVQRLQQRCSGASLTEWRKGLLCLEASNPLPGIATGLSWSYRAKDAPWILEMADLVRPGSGSGADRFISVCGDMGEARPFLRHQHQSDFYNLCREAWSTFITGSGEWSASNPPDHQSLSELMSHFQLICGTNHQVSRANRNGLKLIEGDWNEGGPLPHGCPILIERNQLQLDLANGDQGLLLGRGPGTPGTLAFFPGRIDPVPVPSLPDYKPAFGLTIHKSQGSEWKTVAIDISKGDPGLLDRNLLYTAITRSSHRVDLLAPDEMLRKILGES